MYKVALLLILAASTAFAQLDVSVTKVERVKPGHGPQDAQQVTLHIQNNSNKDVAAFNIELSLKQADETIVKSGSIEDFGYRATHNGNKQNGFPKLLTPGESRDFPHLINADESIVSIRLIAVIYADRTAHGDADAINDIVSSRKHFADQLAKQEPEHAAKAVKYAKDDLRREP